MNVFSVFSSVPPDRAFFSYSALLNSVTAIALVILILSKKRNTEKDWAFSAFCGSIGWWNFFYFLWAASSNENFSFFSYRMIFTGTPFTAATFFHVIRIYSNEQDSGRKGIVFAYGVAAGFAVLSFSQLLFTGVRPMMVFPYWPIPGKMFSIHFTANSGFVTWCLWMLYKSYRRATGIKKEQGRFIFYSSLFAAPGSLLNYLPFYGVEIKPYGNAFIFFQLAIMAYVILKYRLVDLNLVARNILIHGLFGLALSGPLLMIIWSAQSLRTTSFLAVVGIILGPYFFRKIRSTLEQTVDRLPVFGERYAKFRASQTSFERLEKSANLEEWEQRLMETVHSLFPVKTGSLLVWDDSQAAYLIKGGWGLSLVESKMLSLRKESPLALRMNSRKDILMAEMAAEIFQGQDLQAVLEEFSFLRASIVAPIHYAGALRAVLNLSALPEERMFNDLELAHLGSLIRVAEHSLEVVLSGTEKLKKTALLAHDLVKPFTAKGSLHKLEELIGGRFGILSEEAKRHLRFAIDDFSFVGRHLKDIIYPEKDETVNLAAASISNVYHRIREKYEYQAQERGVLWRVYPPPDSIRVYCDIPLIEHRVITNLVDNAFRHTPAKGAIELGADIKNGMFVGYVRDTGAGIDIKDQARVFNYGAQLEKSRAGEAGLGLYSVKSVIEASGGKIWVESEPGKGCCFYFQLALGQKGVN